MISVTIYGCSTTYSFTGTSIADNIETFQVNYFQNSSNLIEPGFDRGFKLALEDLISNQTNLNLTTTNGDLIYEGEISSDKLLKPESVDGSPTSFEDARLNIFAEDPVGKLVDTGSIYLPDEDAFYLEYSISSPMLKSLNTILFALIEAISSTTSLIG